jgi:hypothetical protein
MLRTAVMDVAYTQHPRVRNRRTVCRNRNARYLTELFSSTTYYIVLSTIPYSFALGYAENHQILSVDCLRRERNQQQGIPRMF